MYGVQAPWVELFRTLHQDEWSDSCDDVLERWLERHPAERRWLDEFKHRTNNDWFVVSNEDLCRLYAIYRVTSTLLLCFQTGRADGMDWPGPAMTVDGFRSFHEQLGFQAANVTDYHPFFHEILSVTQSPDDESSIRIDEYVWPCLMLGDMMFCRAGCVVTGGASHVVKDIAESSKLYWTYRRKDRPYADESFGWGNKSQWRTPLRRDYRLANGFDFNIDGDTSLNESDGMIDDLPVETMIELIRNRCLIKTQLDDSDLCPYGFRYTEQV